MSFKDFERDVLARPGARERIAAIERQLLVAYGLRDARKNAGISQRELARRLGVSQPRVAAIERAEDLNLSTLTRYAEAIGGQTRVEIVVEGKHVLLLGS